MCCRNPWQEVVPAPAAGEGETCGVSNIWRQPHTKEFCNTEYIRAKWTLFNNRSVVQGVPSACGLGLVDLDFECFTVCPILLRLMRIWQKRLGSWTRRWSTQIKVNPTQVHEQMGHPV